MFKKYKAIGSSLNLNKDHSGPGRRERTQEKNSLLQEKLIDNQKISARINGLDISKSTFNRITKRDLKWRLHKMQVRKERNNYKWSWFTENKTGFNYLIHDASLSSKNGGPSTNVHYEYLDIIYIIK